MFTEILVKNGLSEKGAKLYLTVLEVGEMTMGRIATTSKLKRSTVYSLVEDLNKKGIVSVTKRKGIKYVSPLAPRLLIERFEQSTEMAQSILPHLIQMAYASPVKPRIHLYEGLEGIGEILFEAASSKQDYIGCTDFEKMPKEMYNYIRKKIAPQREKDGIKLRLIVPNNETNLQRIQEYQHQVEYRMVNLPSRENHIEILLYQKSKIGFMSYKKNEMFGVVIDSEPIYTTLHDLFMVIWNGAH